MAEVCALQYQPDNSNLRQAYLLQRPHSDYQPPHRELQQSFSLSTNPYSMASLQALYSQFPESNERAQRDLVQDRNSHGAHPSANAPMPAAFNGLPYATGGTHLQSLANTWTADPRVEQYIMASAEESFRRNNRIIFAATGTSNIAGKNGDMLDFGRSFMGSGYFGTSMGEHGSDPGVDSAPSPNSFGMEVADNAFGLGTMPEGMTANGGWYKTDNSFELGTGPSQPGGNPEMGTSLNSSRQPEGRPNFDYAGFQMMDPRATGFQTPSTSGYHADNELPLRSSRQAAASDYSYSDTSSPTDAPWFRGGYASGMMPLAARSRDNPAQQDPYSGLPTSASSSASDDTQNQAEDETTVLDSSVEMPAAQQSQPRRQFPMPPRLSGVSQRKRNDEILIKCKRDGLTYKEIRKRLIGETPAESTLRGRFRTLTKERKDRVRKPAWTQHDVNLLKTAVERELDRVDNTVTNPHSLTTEQRLQKVSWKSVAAYITQHGGTYSYGNSTCKKMWLQCNPGSTST